MTSPKNAPITLQLPGHVLDALADWARADGQYMRLPHPQSERAEKDKAQWANSVARRLLDLLPVLPGETDLATAMAERDAGYAEYNASQSTDKT